MSTLCTLCQCCCCVFMFVFTDIRENPDLVQSYLALVTTVSVCVCVTSVSILLCASGYKDVPTLVH